VTLAAQDLCFEAMGCRVRLIVAEPGPDLPPAATAVAEAERFVHEFDAALSRFRPDSELCALNADPRPRVTASELLRRAVGAGLAAAERSGGLVDPTLVGEIEHAGYAASRVGLRSESLAAALAVAPARRPSGPDPRERWRQVEIDDGSGEIVRPPGLRFDSGGTGKGLAADMIAARLRGYPRFVVDCGGDIRIGGPGALVDPVEVLVEHPLSDGYAYELKLSGGAVATSGIDRRIWRDPDGGFAHHLLDPATGRPAWTGLVGATALAATAVEAETLAKAALLRGPEGGRAVLAGWGGLLVDEAGRVETVGPIAAAVRTRAPQLEGALR